MRCVSLTAAKTDKKVKKKVKKKPISKSAASNGPGTQSQAEAKVPDVSDSMDGAVLYGTSFCMWWPTLAFTDKFLLCAFPSL